ncbi:MAG: hypothetical protein ACXVGB_00305 [Mycobacteriaceae bacterium]
MAATASISISGSITGLPDGDKTVGPVAISSAAAVGDSESIILANGDNTVTPPARATGCIIVFDPTSTTTKTLKGVGGDTGVPLKKTGANLLTFELAHGAFIINSSAADTGLYTTITFF